MNLRVATIGVIAGTAVAFCIRALGTLVPGIFAGAATAASALALHALATAALVLFFIAFRMACTPESTALRATSLVAAASAAATVVVDLRGLLRILADRPASYVLPDAVVPLLGAASALAFFVALQRYVAAHGTPLLGPATRAAVFGTSLLVCSQIAVVANYARSGDLRYLGATWGFPAGVVLIHTLALVSLLYFFVTLYRETAPGGTVLPRSNG